MTSSADPGSSATMRSGLLSRTVGCVAGSLHGDRVRLLQLAQRLHPLTAGGELGYGRCSGKEQQARSHVGWHYGEDATLHAG